MSEFRRYRPKRRMTSEIYSLALILWLPVAVALVFPFGAIGFSASDGSAVRRGSCRFVELTAAESAAAIETARSALKTAGGGVRGLYADLSVDAVPVDQISGVASSEMLPPKDPAPVPYSGFPLPPTLSAVKAPRIEPDGSGDGSVFGRNDMLDASEIPENKPE